MNVIKFSPIWGNNTGDLIISRVIEEEMARRGIVVHSYDWMFRTKKAYQKTANLRPSTFHRAASYLQRYAPDLFWFLKIAAYFYKKDGQRYASAMEGFDHVLIGGGNLLMDKRGSDYSFRAASIVKCAKVGVSIVGIGAGPFRRRISLRIIEKYLLKCHHVWMRDNISASCFENTPDRIKHVVPDPAFLISNYFTISKFRKPKFVGVNLVGDHLNEMQLRVLAKHITCVCENHDYSVKIINTAYPFDGVSSNNFLKMLPDHIRKKSQIVNLDDSSDSFIDAFSDLDFFLGSRMHSIIFAASYKIPVAGISWDRKVAGVLEMVYGEHYKKFHLDCSLDDFDSETRRVLNELTDACSFQTYAGRISELQGAIEKEFDVLCQELKSDSKTVVQS